MTVLIYILAIIAVVITLAMLTKVRLVLEADTTARVYLKILFFSFCLYPKKKKKLKISDYSTKKLQSKANKKKARMQKKKSKANKASKTASKTKKQEKLSLADVSQLVSLVYKLSQRFFSKFSRHLRLDLSRVHINVACEDAAKTALAYGAVSGGAAMLVEFLDNTLKARQNQKRDICIAADFLSDNSSIDISISASLRVWQAIDIAMAVAFKFVKEKFL